MSEIYDNVDTSKYFDINSAIPSLEYIVYNSISDFSPKLALHTIFELYVCVDGTGEIQIDNKTINIKKNDIILINPYLSHGTKAKKNENLTYYILGIDHIQFADNDNKFCYEANTSRLSNYINFLWDESKNPGESTKMVVNNMLNVILNELKSITDTNYLPFKKLEASIIATNVANYIDKHYNQDITIDDLTKIFSYAKSTIMHSFKKSYGISIGNYLMNKRLEEVKLWLKISNLPINSIALDHGGFSSIPYFYKYFTEKEGMTPGEYREKYQEHNKKN